MNVVLDALKFRHACKKFDPNREISRSDLNTILECARLSPSSFGMEPWRFLVIQDKDLRAQLRKSCWNQPQITDCSEVIVILNRPNIVKPDTDYVKTMFKRRNLSAEATSAYIERYQGHMKEEVEPLMSYCAWTSKQCYIALANIMTAAAAVGIDSCPIEGFVKRDVEATLEIQTDDEVAVVVALGYRAGEQTTRLRHNPAQIIEYR